MKCWLCGAEKDRKTDKTYKVGKLELCEKCMKCFAGPQDKVIRVTQMDIIRLVSIV